MNSTETTSPANPARGGSFLVRRVLLHGYRFLAVVAVILLIRFQSVAMQATGPADAPPELSQVQRILPDATEVTPSAKPEGWFALDSTGEKHGFVVTTSPQADHIVGFSGPTNVLVVSDTAGHLRGIEILTSRDTPEHVEAIERHPPFFKQFVGLPADELATAKLDTVSGATLTSMAIVESVITRLGGDPPNYRFPDEIDLEESQKFFEAATEIVPAQSAGGLVDIRDADGEFLGRLFRTSPHADHIVGYQGPTDALVALNNQDEVIGIRLRHSYDNQPYVRYVNEDYNFPEVLNETTWQQLVELDLEASGIEGISGATMTSQAMIDAIFVAARKIEAAKSAPPKIASGPSLSVKLRDLGTILVVLFAMVVAFTSLRSNRWVRLGFPLVLIFYLGFYNGDVLSQALWVGWAQHGIPWHRALGLVVLAAAAFAIPLVSKKQLYCNHVCPHGQAQILFGRYFPWRWKMPRWLRGVLRPLPAVLLLLVVVTAMGKASVNLSSIEPFNAYIPSIAGWMAISIAIGGLVFSAFVPMGYCKYGCPTGAVLSHLRYQAKSDQWTHRDTIATLLVVVAIGCFFV